MSQEKCTIQAAAKALSVTTKTIYRYLSNGTLSKIKEGTRTYILIDEVRKLRSEMSVTQENGVLTDQGHGDTDTITIKLKEYTALVDELGQYKGQVTGQAKYLLEYKASIEGKDKVILEQQTELDRLKSEVERLKVPFWRRIFKR